MYSIIICGEGSALRVHSCFYILVAIVVHSLYMYVHVCTCMYMYVHVCTVSNVNFN